MVTAENTEETKKDKIWIISGGRPVDLDLSSICEEPVPGTVMEYEISELAHYLLNPDKITLEEKVIGCKVRYRKPRSGKVQHLMKKFARQNKISPNNPFTEEMMSYSKIGDPAFQDSGLNSHFIKISEILRQYDPVQKKLAGLDREKIDDITAICEEISGNRYPLNLQGSINEKISFVLNSISKKVKVVFNNAYFLNGLFEMRGFKFDSFNENNRYRLIKFPQDNRNRYGVMNTEYKLEYWINDNTLVNYMHILEQSIKTDSKLREILALCINGKAAPLKLFFSNQMEQKYSEKHLPVTYREIFDAYKINPNEQTAITKILNNSQSIVTLNYVPISGTETQKLFTNVSIMHDIKALEPIKSRLPELYSEINKKARMSDAGKMYLLDSLRGSQNV
jgi:hypothetical protein